MCLFGFIYLSASSLPVWRVLLSIKMSVCVLLFGPTVSSSGAVHVLVAHPFLFYQSGLKALKINPCLDFVSLDLFDRLSPSLIGVIPYAGIDLAVYETLKEVCLFVINA